MPSSKRCVTLTLPSDVSDALDDLCDEFMLNPASICLAFVVGSLKDIGYLGGDE